MEKIKTFPWTSWFLSAMLTNCPRLLLCRMTIVFQCCRVRPQNPDFTLLAALPDEKGDQIGKSSCRKSSPVSCSLSHIQS